MFASFCPQHASNVNREHNRVDMVGEYDIIRLKFFCVSAEPNLDQDAELALFEFNLGKILMF